MRTLLAVATLLVLTADPASAQGYRYYGLHHQRGPVTIQLDTAHTPSGHIAVWFGANDAHHWVQAGIAVVDNTSPFLYIETNRNGTPTIHTWPTQLHDRIRIRVTNRHGYWAVHAAGHTSPRIRLNHPAVISVLETYGAATGTARVNRQHIAT